MSRAGAVASARFRSHHDYHHGIATAVRRGGVLPFSIFHFSIAHTRNITTPCDGTVAAY